MGQERKKKVPWQGQIVDGTEVSFQTSREPWTEYLLDDGSVIKLKTVATEVIRLENTYDPSGDPIYTVKSTQIVAVSANEKLRKQG
jgi:hypothetical protein